MSKATQTAHSPADMHVRGEGKLKCGEMLPRYAAYDLGPEKLLRMLSRRHATSGNAYHLHDAGYRRNATQGPRADAYDLESTGAIDSE